MIDQSSPERFYETYKQYYLDTVNFNKQEKKLYYVLLCREYGEMFFAEGYSMEEIYFILLFKIDFCWEDIYGCEYSLDKLKDPVKLFYDQYVNNEEHGTNYYIFEEVKFMENNL